MKTTITKIESTMVGVPTRWVVGIPDYYNSLPDFRFYSYEIELPENAVVATAESFSDYIYVNNKHADIVGLNKNAVQLITTDGIFKCKISEIK